jgi:excisionase family DNA binding protein
MSQTATPEATKHPVDPGETDRLASVSRKTAYRLSDRGDLHAVRIGVSVRVRSESLDAYPDGGSR